MKVAITSYGEQSASKLDRSFGRTKYFVVMDTDTETFDVHSNKQNYNSAQGAGIQAAQAIANLGVDVVITGNIGPKAFRTLDAASIKIFIADKNMETVQDAFSQWKAGQLKEVTEATVEGHWI